MNTGFIYAILASVTWGFVYAADQRLLEKVSPITLLFINYIICLLCTIPFMFLYRKGFSEIAALDKKFLIAIIANAVLLCIANYFIMAGIKNLNASLASVIEISYPFFVVLFSVFLYKFYPNYMFILGSIFLFIGAFLILKSA